MLSGMWSVAFALSESDTDCGIVRENIAAHGDISLEGFGVTIAPSHYPDPAILLALRHLQSYCCKQRVFDPRGDYCHTIRDDGPDSPYLIDHLVDVRLRMLDGDPAYNDPQLVNDKGRAWRETMRENANKAEWLPPKQIYNDFATHWGSPVAAMTYTMVFDNISLWCSQFAEAKDLWSLRMEYHATCDIAYCLYHDMQSADYRKQWRGIAQWASDPAKLLAWYQWCHSMVQQRVKDEASYVWLTMLEQANTFSNNLIRSYTQTYFMDNRFANLLKKFVEQQQWLEIITRKIGEGTAECSM